MNKQYFNHMVLSFVILMVFITLSMVLVFHPAPKSVWADDLALDIDSQTEKDKIHITSNSLVTNNEAGFAEFIGDVIAKQGDTIITSDKLKIFYKKSDGAPNEFDAGGDSVEKMVAQGNVKIRMDNRLGESDKAEYFKTTGIIILTGKNAKLTSGNNTVSGNKITIYRDTNNMTVEHDGKKRVEALLFSNDM